LRSKFFGRQRGGQIWEIREVGKFGRSGRFGRLGGLDGLGGPKDLQDPLAGNECIFATYLRERGESWGGSERH
jgi:hypothetical protein